MIARLRSGNLVLDLGDIHPASAAICVALSKFLDLSSFRFLPFPEVRWVKPVFYFLKKLECNCFTIFCSSLLYNKVNQLYVYISPVPRDPPSRPSKLIAEHRAELPVLHSSLPPACVSHLRQGIYAGAAVPVHPAPSSPPLGPHISFLRLHLHSFPTDRFICNIFLSSTYIHYYMILVFLFLTCFTLYDKSSRFTPWCYKWPSFIPFLWLSNIPLYTPLLYPFICWRTSRLLPCPSY